MSSIELLKSPVLLVIDMQEYFRPVAAPLIPRMNPLIGQFRALGLPVYFSKHGHKAPDAEAATSVLVDRTTVEEAIRVGSDAWALLEELDSEPGDRVIPNKSTYDCFFGTTLHEQLQKQGITTVVCCGVMTELCVETTARSAFVHNYKIVVVGNCCATSDPKHHQCSLNNIEFGFGPVLDAADVMQRTKELHSKEAS